MEEESLATPQTIRIYVGGLGEGVNSDDLRMIFSSMNMGDVLGIDILRTKGRSLAYIDYLPSSDKSLHKLFSTYNGCLWKGGRLRLEKAKENYLARMKREWAEDAELASEPPVSEADMDNNSLKNPKEALTSDNKLLKIFFPRLRKIKSLPFSGTGKHKYSFQRVAVPSLPKHFCDCEEHSTLQKTEVKDIHKLESQAGEIHEEELNIMNSVMNRLFQREKVPKSEHSGTQVANEERDTIKPVEDPHFDGNEVDLEEDEDNLIINVVSRSSNRLPARREHEVVNQNLIFNGIQTSKDEQAREVVKEKRRDTIPSKQKSKLVIHEESKRNKPITTDTEGRESSIAQSNRSGSKTALVVENTTPVLDSKTACDSISWSQKFSWKKLIGDGGNSAFSVTNCLAGISSYKQEQPISTSKELDLANSGKQILEESKVSKGKVGMSDVVEERVETQPTEFSSLPNEENNGQPTKFSSLPNEENNGLAQHVVPEERTSNEPPIKKRISATHEGIVASVLIAANPENETHASPLGNSEVLGNQTIEPEAVEPLVEVQNTKPISSKNTGRGSSWLQKSSWTQLVNENNGIFSLTQIVPSATLANQEVIVPTNMDVTNCVNSQQPIVTNNEASADTVSVEGKICDPVPQKTSGENPSIEEEGCSFMRNAASMKEWAKAKKSLSASRKRKNMSTS